MLYITERCVFQLTKQGLELIEVAPGIDIKRDILDRMDFEPIVTQAAGDGPEDFQGRADGIARRYPAAAVRRPVQLRRGAQYSLPQSLRTRVKNHDIIERYRERHIRSIVEPLGHKVYAVVNYDGFDLDR